MVINSLSCNAINPSGALAGHWLLDTTWVRVGAIYYCRLLCLSALSRAIRGCLAVVLTFATLRRRQLFGFIVGDTHVKLPAGGYSYASRPHWRLLANILDAASN